MNGVRYRHMFNTFLFPKMPSLSNDISWSQQGGTTCHVATGPINLLIGHFGDCVISRNGLVNWPPRLCNLMPLDYSFREYVKPMVYDDKPRTFVTKS